MAISAQTEVLLLGALGSPEAVTDFLADLHSITASELAAGQNAANIADGTVSNAEFQYIGTLTSNAQTQLTALGSADTALALRATTLENGAFVVASPNVETSTSGALSVTKLLSNITTAGAESRTLAAPAGAGLFKIIEMTARVGDCTLAMTNIVGGRAANGDAASTTVTFGAVGQTLILMSASSKWVYLGGSAVCT